jgi:hypothetical protein
VQSANQCSRNKSDFRKSVAAKISWSSANKCSLQISAAEISWIFANQLRPKPVGLTPHQLQPSGFFLCVRGHDLLVNNVLIWISISEYKLSLYVGVLISTPVDLFSNRFVL